MAIALDFMAGDERIGVYEFQPVAENRPFWGLVVLARDQPGLFATVCGVIAACGHDILGAQAYTTRGALALEIYEVSPTGGGQAEREVERQRLESSLREVIDGARSVEALVGGRRPEPVRAVRRAGPSVDISNEESDFYTVIDVTTNDRPALLHDMARTLFECDLNVVMSRASTRAHRATDAFYVTDAGSKITDPERREQIRERLLDAIRRDAG